MRVLALDLGGTTGYAYRVDGEDQVFYNSTIIDEGISEQRSYLPAFRLGKFLQLLHNNDPIQEIIYEETFARGLAKFRLDSMSTAVAIFCIANNVTWTRLSVSQMKKMVTGNGQAGKEQILKVVRDNYDVEGELTYDESDALGLLYCWDQWNHGLMDTDDMLDYYKDENI